MPYLLRIQLVLPISVRFSRLICYIQRARLADRSLVRVTHRLVLSSPLCQCVDPDVLFTSLGNYGITSKRSTLARLQLLLRNSSNHNLVKIKLSVARNSDLPS